MLSAHSGFYEGSETDSLSDNEGECCGVQEVYDLLQAAHHLFKADQGDKNNHLFTDVRESDDKDYNEITEATKKLFESKEKIVHLITSLSQRGNEDSKADSSYIKTRKQVNRYLGKNALNKEDAKKAEKIIISLASCFVPSQEVKGYDKGKPYYESFLDPGYVLEKCSGYYLALTNSGIRLGDKLPQWLQEKIANGYAYSSDRIEHSGLVSYVTSSSKKVPAYIASRSPLSSSEYTLGDEKVSRQAEVEARFYANNCEAPLFAFNVINDLIESAETGGVNFDFDE
jgi:hypothetical protein